MAWKGLSGPTMRTLRNGMRPTAIPAVASKVV